MIPFYRSDMQNLIIQGSFGDPTGMSPHRRPSSNTLDFRDRRRYATQNTGFNITSIATCCRIARSYRTEGFLKN